MVQEEITNNTGNVRISDDLPDRLTIKFTMNYLGKSRKTLRNWEKSKFLVPIRNGTLILYRKEDVLKIVV